MAALLFAMVLIGCRVGMEDETITWKQGQIYFYDEYNELFTQGERNAILKHLNPGCPDIGGLK